MKFETKLRKGKLKNALILMYSKFVEQMLMYKTGKMLWPAGIIMIDHIRWSIGIYERLIENAERRNEGRRVLFHSEAR